MPATKNVKTHCINGHPFKENGRFKNDGSRYCNICRKENNRKQAEKRKTDNAYKKKQKEHYCKKMYGISLDKALEMFDKQNGKCLICNNNMHKGKRGFCVDHNHKTGEIRGILCSKCNTGIGLLQENIKTLENAIEYLKKSL